MSPIYLVLAIYACGMLATSVVLGAFAWHREWTVDEVVEPFVFGALAWPVTLTLLTAYSAMYFGHNVCGRMFR